MICQLLVRSGLDTLILRRIPTTVSKSRAGFRQEIDVHVHRAWNAKKPEIVYVVNALFFSITKLIIFPLLGVGGKRRATARFAQISDAAITNARILIVQGKLSTQG